MSGSRRERLVAALEELGLSTYEARAYAALLRSGAVTGYQVSRLSGVPRSRIYEALEKLVRRGMVLRRNGQPSHYRAAEWEEVLQRAASGIQRTIETIRSHCASAVREFEADGVWNVTGRANLVAKASAMVRTAERTVDAVAPAPELAEVEGSLADAERRGCRVRLVICGAFRPAFGEVYQHSFTPELCDDLALVIDAREALVASARPEDHASGAWSREPAFVHVTEQYVLHEVFLAQALDGLDPVLAASLADRYRRIVSRPATSA